MIRHLTALTLLLGAGLAFAQPEVAAPGAAMDQMADEAFFQQAANCVALFKQDALALKAEAQGGSAPAKAEMVQLTAWGFGLIGTAYKRGLRNPRADAILSQAEREQSDWPDAKRAALTAQCKTQARTVFANASGIERALVNNRAAARVDKLLNSK